MDLIKGPCLFYWCILHSFFHDIVWWTLMTDWQSHDISIFQAHKGNFRKRATLQNAHFYFSEYSHLGSTQRSEKYTKGQISGQSIKYLAFVIAIFVEKYECRCGLKTAFVPAHDIYHWKMALDHTLRQRL